MLGSDEINGGEIQLKDLKTKAVHKMGLTDLDKMVKVING
jgi:histidyl-tRNA synthetase